MSDGQWGTPALADQAVTNLSRAIADTIAVIDAVEDPDEAWSFYLRLREVIPNNTSVAALRDRLADRIRTKHQLSLAQLGELIGVGKSRAGQMVDGAKAQLSRKDT